MEDDPNYENSFYENPYLQKSWCYKNTQDGEKTTKSGSHASYWENGVIIAIQFSVFTAEMLSYRLVTTRKYPVNDHKM